MIAKIVNNGFLNQSLDKGLAFRFAPLRILLVFFVLMFVLCLYAIESFFTLKSFINP